MCGLPAAWALWRGRRSPSPFDLGVWLLSLALLISAVRGLMFFSIVSVAVFQRCVLRVRAAGGTMLPQPIGASTVRLMRVIGFTFTAMLACTAVFYRWVRPSPALAGLQPGLGRAVGGWAEAATDFLRGAPPPGRMLNIGGGLGDDVIFWLPGVPVFVDSRLESYPPEFLRAVLAAETSDAELGKLIERYDAQWVLADHTRPDRRERVLGLLKAGWQPVYADSATIVLVRPTAATEAYRRAHAVDLARVEPGDLVAAPADLRNSSSVTSRPCSRRSRDDGGVRADPAMGAGCVWAGARRGRGLLQSAVSVDARGLGSPPLRHGDGVGAAYARVVPLPSLTLTPAGVQRAGVTLLIAMWAAYALAMFLVSTLRGSAGARTAVRLVVIAGVVASVALILTPPVLADLYDYAMFGRMVLTRGLNPYVTPPSALQGDPLLPLANWQDYTTHYGPVFTGLSVAAAWLGAGGAIATALAFKTLATGFGALAAWAASRLAEREGRSGLLPLALIAWNPLALIESAGSGHNEMVMMGLALAGLLVMARGRSSLGFVLLVASVHVKWVSAAVVGLVLIAHLHGLDGWRARARQLAKLLAVAVAMTVVLYLPFWAGSDSMAAVRRLMLESRNAAGDKVMRLGNLLPFGAVVALAIALVTRYGRRFAIDMAAAVNLAFAVFVFNWIFPWYVLPALPLLAVGPLSKTNGALLLATSVCSVFLMKYWTLLVQFAA